VFITKIVNVTFLPGIYRLFNNVDLVFALVFTAHTYNVKASHVV